MGYRRLVHLTLLALCALAAAAAPAAHAARPIVAVIDTGVDESHPALRGLLWRNPDEIPRNRRDDDLNGFVDDVNGADYVGKDGRPFDRQGHGTHVAGIIARTEIVDNRRGQPTGARIMALRVASSVGKGHTQALANAIDYAVTGGARIINISLAYFHPSSALEEALREAQAAGVLVVVAAGNRSEDLDTTPVYPASYNLPGMLVVGAAVGPAMAWWSARGPQTVDLAAPADAISTLPGGLWGKMTGTSQSAAHVSRAAALLWAADPRLRARDVRRAILRGARPLPQLQATTATGAELDLHGALRRLRVG